MAGSIIAGTLFQFVNLVMAWNKMASSALEIAAREMAAGSAIASDEMAGEII